MKLYIVKLFLLLVIVGGIAYLNYPSFSRFFSVNSSQTVEIIENKFEFANQLLSELRQFSLALPDADQNRIEVLVVDASAGANFDNLAIKKIIADKFSVQEEESKFFLVQKEFSPDDFISDYARSLNELFENVRRIDSLSLSEDKMGIVFQMVEGKRLALISEPLPIIFEEGQYDWLYDPITSSYTAALADSPYLLNLGLDLKGGIYLDVGLDQAKTINNFLKRRVTAISELLDEEGIVVDSIDIEDDSNIILTKVSDKELDLLSADWQNLLVGFDLDQNQTEVNLSLQDDYISQLEGDSIDQAITIIRSRIDLLGVKDPIIQRRGGDSIVVQVPGQTDSTRIKELITQPANLEFRLVVDRGATADDSEVLLQETLDPITKEVIASSEVYVEKLVAMGGDVIADARVSFEQYTGAPQVSFDLSADGAAAFGDITAANIGRQLAIVLDNKVRSAPRINSAIYGGQGSITGQFSVDEARDLAIVLRSGALAASLSIEEERIIGASLGADSVRKSLYSFIIGFLALVLFMVIYYRVSGGISVFALLINLFLMLSILAFFGATLTLPGIAGIILSIAMAVDANVLIYERIREELRGKSSPRASIQQGFKRVAVTILDSNITTLLIAAVLFQFGTGPIRGFAVTLAIGIFSTIFTSLVISSWVFDIIYLRKRNLTKISI